MGNRGAAIATPGTPDKNGHVGPCVGDGLCVVYPAPIRDSIDKFSAISSSEGE
jgi:hypothetical protein